MGMFLLGLIALPVAFVLFCKWQEYKFNRDRRRRQIQQVINQQKKEERAQRIKNERGRREEREALFKKVEELQSGIPPEKRIFLLAEVFNELKEEQDKK